MVVASRSRKIRRIRRKVRRKSSPLNAEATQQTVIAPPTFQNSLKQGELSAQEIVQMQRVVGNRAMLQLTNSANPMIHPRGVPVGLPATFEGMQGSVPNGVLQRLPTKAIFDADIKKDVKKYEKEQAKKKAKEGENEDGGLFNINKLVSDVVDNVVDAVQKSAYEKLLKALEEFHVMHTEYKKLNPDYMDLGALLWHIKEVEKSSEALLFVLKNDDPRTKRVKYLKEQAVELFVKQSPNADRAKAAEKKLKNKQKDNSERITDELIKILVMAIAMPRNLFETKGAAGVIGIDQAVRAVEALVLLSDSDYGKIMGLLTKSGDDWGEVAQKATILKALAARKKDLAKAGPQTAEAIEKIEKFAAEIRKMKRDDMLKATSATDRGSDEGLQQRFTMSCGPTSIQIVKAEIDPIYALSLTKQAGGLKSWKYEGDIGDEQKDLLEEANSNQSNIAVPRQVEKDWKDMLNAVSNHINGLSDATEQRRDRKYMGAVFNYLQGNPHMPADLISGTVLMKNVTSGIDIDKRILEWKKLYVPLTSGGPGTKFVDFPGLIKKKTGDATDQKFNAIQTYIEGRRRTKWKVKEHVDKLDKALFKGQNVPFGIWWNSNAGHFMVFVDMREEKKGKKTEKHYLIADPWEGKSFWISRKDMIKGKFSNAGFSGDGNIIWVYF